MAEKPEVAEVDAVESVADGDRFQLMTAEYVIYPPDRRFWLYDEMFAIDKHGMHVPRFSVQEVAKVFFGEGADWLRWRMRADRPTYPRCPSCRGAGSYDGKECTTCGGFGSIESPPRHPHGFFLLDGEPLQFKRLAVPEGKKSGDPNVVTARYYTLADVERMGHALFQQNIIDLNRLASIILTARSCAHLYGVVEARIPVIGSETPEIVVTETEAALDEFAEKVLDAEEA